MDETTHSEGGPQTESAGGAVIGSGSVGGGTGIGGMPGSVILTRIGLGNRPFFDEMADVKLSDVKAQLDSDSDKEKLTAMMRLLAVSSSFFSNFFLFRIFKKKKGQN